jgi:uncharacterized protein
MKKRWTVLAIVTLALIPVTMVGCTYSGGAQVTPPTIAGYMGAPVITSSQQQTGLWVNGEGKSKAAPDLVILSLGVEAESKTVARAQQDASQAMDAVMQALKANGIADKDIQTQRFSIYPVTQWIEDQQRQIITGYRVTNIVIAKIRQLDKAGSIIDDVAAAGGNLTRIDNIGFSIEDPTPLYKEARGEAIDDAIAKAKQMAGAADVKLGKLIYISESTPYMPNIAVKDYAMRAEAASPTPISPGELEIQVNVQMVYEIQ